MFKARRKVVLFKIEGTKGVDAAPAAATDALLVRNFQFNPLQLAYEDRDYAVPYFGNKGKVIAGQWAECSFEIEMAGAGGAVDAVPKWGPVARACGMAQTVNAAVSVVYAPVTTNEVTGSLYFYLDGRLHKILSWMGNLEARAVAGRIPVLAFSGIGLHVAPSDSALVTPTLTGFTKPVAVNAANTTPATLHAFAGKIREISFATGNVLPYRNLPNSESIQFVDRMSRGSVRMEDELVATKDWWTSIKNGTLGALSLQQGQTAGNKVTLAAPNVQLTEPAMDEEDGISMVRMSMELQPSAAGNDEFSITTT